MNLELFQNQILESKIIEDRNDYFREIAKHSIVDGDVVEMGVFNGQSLKMIEEAFPDDNIFGFDSFKGLPEDWVTSDDYTVPKSFFNLDGIFSGSLDRTKILNGWFCDSIAQNKNNINQLKFLHVDCDLYSSTKTILEEFNDHIKVGTTIAFDEFMQFPEAKSKWYSNWQEGEYKACIEWMNTYDRELIPICRSTQEQCCFIVKK